MQKESERFDLFATDLINLTEYCAFQDLRDELIRGGILDGKLTQQMQMISDLTL